MKKLVLLLISFLIPTLALAEEQLLDTVVASVDNQPITLKDLGERLSPPRKLSIKEASADPAVRYALDQIINDQLIREEAKSRHIEVTDHDVDNYIDEVSKRNSLSREGFIKALSDEKITLPEYKRRISIEILKSRLSSSIARDGAGVSDEEIDGYLRQNPQLNQSGSQVKLSQIVINYGQEGIRSQEEAQQLVKEIQDKAASGESFENLASKYSDSTDAQDGGSLGLMAEKELSHEILDAVLLLKKGEISSPVDNGSALRIFRLDDRFAQGEAQDEEHDKLRAEIRSVLERQKLESKMSAFFSVDLYKKHTVDKKI